MRIAILLLFVSICALNLSACGQKGPLYLPDDADEQSFQLMESPQPNESNSDS